MAQDWALVDALMGGTRAMRAAKQAYLPQWPAEDGESYKARLATSTLFPAYQRTVSVLTGKPFSKPITIGDDVPPRVAEMLPDVDLEGRNLDVFAAEVCEDALARGFCGILVDCPPNPGARTVAEEQQAGIRPYLVHIKAGAILGWKSEVVGGQRKLTQLRLLETVEVEDGPFATKAIEQVRVLTPGAWQTYRAKATEAGKIEWVLFGEGVSTLPEIPFIPVYGRRAGFMVGTPPMLELAHANVEHWQSKSDQQTILHVARVPLLFAKGLAGTTITVGAGSFVSTDGEHADLKYVEHSGAAIEAGRLSLLDLEDRMRQAGAELLVIKPGNITEVQTVADNEQGMCDLQRIVQVLEDCIDQALALMARWVGLPTGGTVEIYRDFGAATLAEASAELLAGMEARGGLSRETLYAELKRRGILGPGVDVHEELERAKVLPADKKPDPAAPEPDPARDA
jgi:hypothetical protein